MPISIQNPISQVIDAALTVFPDLDCDLRFADFPEEGPYGETFWPDDGGRTIVQVAANITLEGVLEVIGHELAHVAVGPNMGHGPQWEAAFDAIHKEFCRRMEP